MSLEDLGRAVTGTPRRRRRDASPPGSRTAVIVLVLVTVVLAGATAADLLAQPAPPPPAEPIEQPAATAGTWYCPAVAGEGESAVLTVTAVGEEPSQVVVDRYAKGRAVPDDPQVLEPGAEAVIELEGDDARAPTAVRWSGGPAAAVWRVDGERSASAPCEAAPSERWIATGFVTTLGSRSLIHLFNPFTADAVVRLVFATPDGEVRLVLTDNILVPAGGTTTRNLGRFQPEIPDLGVTVEVLSGRVVAQGELTVDPPRGTRGASGRTLIPAAPDTSMTWAVAYAAAGEGTESWLSVLNPGEREAAVEVRVSAPSDEGTGLIGEVSVPAGGVARVELAGVSINPEFGVSVTVVNDEPVVVSRMTSLRLGGREALTGGLAAPQLDREWALLGGGAGDRAGLVSIYNPGAEEATVSVVAEGAPAEWSGLVLGPNARAKVALADAGADRTSIPVRVTADVPVVADLRSTSAGEQLRLWLTTGVAAAEWIGPLTRPAVQFDPSLSTRRVQVEATVDPGTLVPEFDPLEEDGDGDGGAVAPEDTPT